MPVGLFFKFNLIIFLIMLFTMHKLLCVIFNAKFVAKSLNYEKKCVKVARDCFSVVNRMKFPRTLIKIREEQAKRDALQFRTSRA